MPDVIIYHNSNCSKSRQTLALLQSQGIQPKIIEYLKTPPTATELKSILQQLNSAPRKLIRKKEPEYAELGLDDLSLSDHHLIQAMIQYPKLIERPIVLANGKVAIGRPPEEVLRIL